MALANVKKLYLNEEQRDVVFLVGPDEQHRVRFPAHKLILSSCSSVFAVMLSSMFQEGRTGEVVVKDVTPTAFRNVVQFAYTGTIQMPSVATFEEILYASHKYLMEDLSKFCFNHLENVTINLDNFWHFFNILCMFYSESMPPNIVIKTFKFLDVYAEKLVSSDEFRNLNSEAVLRIVTRKSLRDISEITILQRVFQWSKDECCRQNIEVTAENEQKVLEKIKYYVRYSLISRNDLMEFDEIMRTILTENEKKIILDSSLQVNNTLPPPWSNKLLSSSRGKGCVLRWNLDSGDNTVPVSPHNIFAIDLVLRTTHDCVFESLGVHYVPQKCSEVKITGEISDLNGNIFSTWVYKNTVSVCNPDGECPTMTAITGKPTCLRRAKWYKLSLFVVNGRFIKLYNKSGFFPDFTNDMCAFLGSAGTDVATVKALLTRDSISQSKHNNFVNCVSIRI